MHSTAPFVLWFTVVGGAALFFAYMIGRYHGRLAERRRWRGGTVIKPYSPGPNVTRFGRLPEVIEHPDDIERANSRPPVAHSERDYADRYDGMGLARTRPTH